MEKVRSRLIALSVLAMAFGFGSADAQTVLDFTAGAASTSTDPDSIYTDFSLTLNSVNGVSASSFSVAQGDNIEATISFNPAASIAIPPDAVFTTVGILLESADFDGTDTGTSNGFASATLGGVAAAGQSAFGSCTTSGQLCDPGLYVAGVTNFAFDTYTTQFTVSTLDAPANITGADLYAYTQLPAVPEPQTYALLAIGLGMLFWLAVRRRTGAASTRFAATV